MRKSEIQLNEREQVTEYLREALALVEMLQPPDDLRTALFVEAAHLLSAKQVFFEQSPAVLPSALRGMQ